ncbi:MAG: hemerythrin domain-containing protein [Planctomycetes bacterium]|nr:hemerythrin domain-containing protein [Planctomycetota bacterium]
MSDQHPEHQDHHCSGMHEAGCGGGANPEADERLMLSLPEGHVIRVLMQEHVAIRASMDELEALADRLARGQDRKADLAALAAMGTRLVTTESHHQREERILFPRLFDRGLVGPPSVMNDEHIELRLLKHRLAEEPLELVDDPEAKLDGLIGAARMLVAILRAHVIKENNILYPMALGIIREDAVWDEMRRESEELGEVVGS